MANQYLTFVNTLGPAFLKKTAGNRDFPAQNA